jgi:phage terminase small subunit
LGLQPRQQRFVEEYLANGGNATQAAIAAGYSEPTAKQQGSRLLTNADVAAAIDTGRAALTEQSGVSAERLIAELSAIAFGDLRDVVRWDDDEVELKSSEEISDDAARALRELVATVEVVEGERGSRTTKRFHVRQHDKLRAIELLGKHLGLFKDTLKHELPGGVKVMLSFDAEAGA